jgi:hypothetical protein
MTPEEWTTIMSVYQLWLTREEKAVAANLREAAEPEVRSKTAQNKLLPEDARAEFEHAMAVSETVVTTLRKGLPQRET